jgi:molecular chaperone GrpE
MQDKKIDDSDESLTNDQFLNEEQESISENISVENGGLFEELSYDELLEDRDSAKDRLMRALAESENIRKRAERDRKDAEIYGGTKLARDLLSVYDNMSRALENINDELREKEIALVEGLELTQRELVSIFSKHKIDQIEPFEGDKFDPKYHQAMFEAPVPGTVKGTVIQVMAKGFKIGDRLLRAAQVGVSSNIDSSISGLKPTQSDTSSETSDKE